MGNESVAPSAAVVPSLADGPRLQAQLDAAAKTAVASADANPGDPGAALTAARALFAAADLRLQRASLELAQAAQDTDAVLAADDAVGDPSRSEILGLCTAGLAHAERAAQHDQGVAPRLQIAMHVSLIAWANGATRALMAGYGSRLTRETEAAVKLDPNFDSAGPLRLLGRVRGKAPWPVGDKPRAKQALSDAVAVAPIAINWLFLGDVLWALGEREPARQAWRKAVSAPGDASTAASLPWLQELARLRVAKSD